MKRLKENLKAWALALLILISVIPASAGDLKNNLPLSNLRMIESCVESMAAVNSMNISIPVSRPVVIAGDARDSHRFALQALSNYFRSRDYRVYDVTVDSAFIINVTSFRADFNYGEIFREKLFGDPLTERNLNVELGFKVTDGISKEIIQGEILTHSLKDTIEVDAIRILEDSSIPMTVATPPTGNFLDRIVEPFIILGATGAAVYLFYHVRTK